MNAYIFQAALLCEECGQDTQKRLIGDSRIAILPMTDSDQYPQGPYSDGGGEADCPQHCDHCGVFLENPLTTDGYEHVKGLFTTASIPGSVIQLSDVAENVWAPFYGISLP